MNTIAADVGLLGGRKRGEVSHGFSRCWKIDAGRCDDGGRRNAQPLVGAEEEGLLANDRAAEVSAKLILNERGDVSSEIVLEVEIAVSQVVVSHAMKLVGA